MPRSGSLAKVVSHLSTVGRRLPLQWHIFFGVYTTLPSGLIPGKKNGIFSLAYTQHYQVGSSPGKRNGIFSLAEGRCIRPRHDITKIIAAARKLLPTTIEHNLQHVARVRHCTNSLENCKCDTDLQKKGTKGDPGNYRPVSLTSVPCKILESIIKDKIMDHLLENNLISDSQHGSMPGRSCATNLVEFMDFVTE